MKVMFHINDPERWGIAARNAKSTVAYCKSLDQSCKVEIVVSGAAARQLKKEDAHKAGLDAGLMQMNADGVVICVCRTSLELQHISQEDLLDFVRIVPLDVAEMAERQAEGYAYIKP